MACQILAPILHGFVCYYLTIVAGYGIVGTGVAGFITNFSVFLLQNYFLRKLEIADAANNVAFSDKRVWNLSGLKSYLALAIPSMFFILIEWSVYDV